MVAAKRASHENSTDQRLPRKSVLQSMLNGFRDVPVGWIFELHKPGNMEIVNDGPISAAVTGDSSYARRFDCCIELWVLCGNVEREPQEWSRMRSNQDLVLCDVKLEACHSFVGPLVTLRKRLFGAKK